MQNGQTTARYNLIDYLRGLNLISMILYHAVWDLVYLCGINWEWYRSEGAYVWQQSICWIFILLSGFCWSMGKKKIRRGLVVLAASVLISLVTGLFLPDERILFGVLTLLGACMLLMVLAEPFCKKIPAIAGMGVSFGCFFVFRNVNEGYLGFERLLIAKLPQGLYQNMITAFLGFPQRGFFSSDYFSLIPWLFLFLFGYFLYRLLSEKGKLHLFSIRGNNKILSFLGRRSLLIYLIHQPVLYCLFLPLMPF